MKASESASVTLVVNCESNKANATAEKMRAAWERVLDSVSILQSFEDAESVVTCRAVENPNADNGVTYVVTATLCAQREAIGWRNAYTWAYCRQHGQDCVAMKMVDLGGRVVLSDLFGPRADAWKPFDAAKFID